MSKLDQNIDEFLTLPPLEEVDKLNNEEINKNSLNHVEDSEDDSDDSDSDDNNENINELEATNFVNKWPIQAKIYLIAIFIPILACVITSIW